MKKRTHHIKQAYHLENVFLQASIGVITGALLSFISGYLLYFNGKNTQVGIVSAISAIFVMLFSPLLAKWNERSQTVNTVHLIQGLSMLGFVITFIMYWTNNLSYILILYFLVMIIPNLLISQVNTLSGELTNRGLEVNYGVARAANSLVYAITAVLIGQLIESWSIEAVTVGAMIGFLMMFICAMSVPLQKIKELPIVQVHHLKEEKTLVTYPKRKGFDTNFILFLISVLFLFTSHSMLNTYLLQIFLNVGGDATSMSITLGFAAVIELPPMIFYEKIRARFKDTTLLIISAWFFFIKALATALAMTVTQLFLAHVFQMFAFAIYITASVYYINRHFPSESVATGQAAAVTASTGGAVFGSLLGGIAIDMFSINVLLIISFCSAFIGAILMTLSLKTSKLKG